MSQIRMPRREVSIPEEESDSEGSDTNEAVVVEPRRRPSRISFSKLWKFSVLSVSPSPRVSNLDIPGGLHGKTHMDELERIERRNVIVCRAAFGIMLVLAITLTVLTVTFAIRASEIQYCVYDESDFVTARDLKNPDVFDDITREEYGAVIQYLMDIHHLNLVPYENASLTDAYIFLIELHMPAKDNTLQYLDEGSKKPERTAKAVIYRGNIDPPVVEEYLVFPLYKPHEAVRYKNPSFRNDHIPFSSRPMDFIEETALHEEIISSVTKDLYALLIESYNLCYHNCTKNENCMEIMKVASHGSTNTKRQSWFSSFRSVDGFYIHPLGLEFLIDHTSTNTSEWFLDLVVYNGQSFPSVSSLMEAFRIKSIVLSQEHLDNEEYNTYSTLEAMEPLSSDSKQGPFLFEPDGKRFKVVGQQIEYNNWAFRYHMRPSNGLMLFDIKFDNVRVVYEISLQDVLVYNTESLPGQYSTKSYDTPHLFGTATTELVRGVDCPESSLFLSSDMWTVTGEIETIKNNICIFENNGAVPLRRHYDANSRRGFNFYGGIADYHLVIRTIATVTNTDYVFDYMFYTNGVIMIKVYLAGYVFATFRLSEDQQYGSVIHDHVISNVHKHMFNYKVDLDIAGTTNRFSTIGLALTKGTEQNNNTRITKIRNIINKETKDIDVDLDNTLYHLFYNADAKDAYGTQRAYKIHNESPISMLMVGDQLGMSTNWVKYPVSVTKRKDDEQASSSIYATRKEIDPVLDFEQYFNDESLVDEDLVSWVTVGFNHVPGTEDVPGTTTNLNHASFTLSPHNYLTECPSVHSTDNVFIRPNKMDNSKVDVKTYGHSFSARCVPKTKGPFHFDGTRK